jgi:hypothetical protein
LALGVQREALAGLERQGCGILFENSAGLSDDADGYNSRRADFGTRLSDCGDARAQAQYR